MCVAGSVAAQAMGSEAMDDRTAHRGGGAAKTNGYGREQGMNKLWIAIALVAVLAACKKEEAASADASTAPAEVADVATAPVNAGLPTECEDYLNRAKACFAKANPQMAASFQQSIDTVKGQWDAVADKSTLVEACKQANDQFAQVVTALSCE